MGKRSGSVYLRGDVWWMAYYDATGKRVMISTGLREEKDARRLLVATRKSVAAQVEAGAAGGSLAAYAETKWLPVRERMGLSGYRNERTRIRKHVIPRLGAMRLEDIEVRHIVALVRDLKADELAPRTIRHVVGDLSGVMREAVIDKLVDRNPCELLRRSDLPPIKDADPRWRASALYTREEVEALLLDPRIALSRRIDYAVAALTGARSGERVALRWKHWDRDRKPLGCLTFEASFSENLKREKGTKTDVPRHVPVHPLLALLLGEWEREGWPADNGHAPGPEDLLLPYNGTHRTHSVMWKGLQRDLVTLGLRARRVHDFRRTTISLAMANGARRDIMQTLTHPSRKQAFDLYLTVPWEALCSEIAKLRVGDLAATPQLHSQRAMQDSNLRPSTGL
ncbi:MAG: site-specific integrase, partial [Gemmatimonadota bacterium]|nr:site-specific integrase [Gemmatimonadota bacterium]